MKVAVVGLWHLGTVTAACLAAVGYDVVGFDEDGRTIERLAAGQPPILEPGLSETVRSGLDGGRLRFSADPSAVGRAEVVWVTYDTPVDDQDRGDAGFVIERVQRLFDQLPPGGLVLISSQLPVGSTRRLEELYAARGAASPGFAYAPENLQLGRAIECFRRPEHLVVGVRCPEDRDRIARFLQPLTERIEWMSVESAEMTKHAINAFLATSVTFANEVAELCERVGADAAEVERGLRGDGRIGPRAYVRAGPAFAGGTLARDLGFLTVLARSHGVPAQVLSAVRRSNETHKEWPRRRLAEALGELRGRSIAVLGLTYKAGTNTLRRSAAVETCRWLRRQGASVRAYDPVIQRLPRPVARIVDLRASCEDALRGAAAVVVGAEWPEFTALTVDDLVAWMEQPVVVDPGRALEQLARDPRIRYHAVGRAA